MSKSQPGRAPRVSLEEWRLIPDVDGKYEVSSHGRVRRAQTSSMDFPFPALKPQRSAAGRGLFLGLRHGGRTRQFSLARLVGRVFLAFPRKKGIVYWKDGNDTNNSVSNLGWAARHEDIPSHLHATGVLDPNVEHAGFMWRSAVGYEGIYEVSANGEVRRVIPGRRGRAVRVLKPCPGRLGYVYVTLAKHGRQQRVPVHRLVAEAFLPVPPLSRAADLVVHHIAEPKSNNRVENLSWATHSQNMGYAAVEAAERRRRGEPPKSMRHEFPLVPADAIWKPLTAFGIDGRFEVSNYGHVRRRIPGHMTTAGRMMAARLMPQGYVQVKLRVPGTKHGVVKSVHILVASAFLPPPQSDQTVIDHKNGDKTDNRAENLEWVTQQENTLRAVAAGRFHPGGRHVAATLSLADVVHLRLTAGTRTRAEHAAKFGVTPSAIDDALSGRTHAGVQVQAVGSPISAVSRGESHARSKLTNERLLEIIRRRRAGESVHAIAADHGVTPGTIYQIMRGMIWQHVTGIDRSEVGFRDSQEDFFTAGLTAAARWCRRHGSLANVKVLDEIDGFPLGAWIDRRRGEHRKKNLSRARQENLERLGIIWSPHQDKWQRGLTAAQLWANRNGDISTVPVTATIDGFGLGRWLATRRVERNAGALDPDRIAALSALGMDWKPKRGPRPAVNQKTPQEGAGRARSETMA